MVLPLFTGIFVTFSPHDLIEFWDNRVYRSNVRGGAPAAPLIAVIPSSGDSSSSDLDSGLEQRRVTVSLQVGGRNIYLIITR